MNDPVFAHLQRQHVEHAAWLDVVDELRAAGVGDIEKDQPHEKLRHAITRWGEELAQLRLGDPDSSHASTGLAERRAEWEKWS